MKNRKYHVVMANVWIGVSILIVAYTLYASFTQGFEKSWVYLLFAGITFFMGMVRKRMLKRNP